MIVFPDVGGGIMKSRLEVQGRVFELREKLFFLRDLINEERKKELAKRSTSLLLFLNKEREVFRFALSELENILEEGSPP